MTLEFKVGDRVESGLPHLAHVATNALFLCALGVKR
jgi:hypothetical protein